MCPALPEQTLCEPNVGPVIHQSHHGMGTGSQEMTFVQQFTENAYIGEVWSFRHCDLSSNHIRLDTAARFMSVVFFHGAALHIHYQRENIL